MKAIKLLFVVLILFVCHPFVLCAQGEGGRKQAVENSSNDPRPVTKKDKPELKTILLPMCNHLNLPVEIDREDLMRRYNDMIDEIDRKYHSPSASAPKGKGLSLVVERTKANSGN